MRRWLARCSQKSAVNAQKDDWDSCLRPEGSSARQNYLQSGCSNSAGMSELDEAADCLALEEFSGIFRELQHSYKQLVASKISGLDSI